VKLYGLDWLAECARTAHRVGQVRAKRSTVDGKAQYSAQKRKGAAQKKAKGSGYAGVTNEAGSLEDNVINTQGKCFTANLSRVKLGGVMFTSIRL